MTLDAERLIHAVAARQDGVVFHEQCRRAGLTDRQIHGRVRSGRWVRLHRGVYAVGRAPLSHRARYLAATFGGGTAAVVSHRSGASLWNVQPHHGGPVHVTNGTARRARDGLHIHRTRRFEPGVRTVRHGVPVTTLARTLVDLAEVGSQLEVETAVRAAERLHGFDRRLVLPIPGRRHAGRLLPPERFTRGQLEPVLLAFLRRHELQLPATNVPWGGFELDAVWWDIGLVMEVDDYETHGNRDAFVRDRRRARAVMAAGFRQIQATYEDLTADGDRFAAELRDLGVPRAALGG